jgi:hypothetical protein
MTFLLTGRPNWIIPLFQQTGYILQYKRFPADYMWRDFLDLSSLVFDPTDINDAIAALDAEVTAVNELATSAYEYADTANSQAAIGIADAATAYALAESASIDAGNAQTTANTALTNAATAQATADAALAGTLLPDCAYLVPSNFRTISVGFATPVLQAGQWTNAYSDLNGSGAIADCKILLEAGDYDFSLGYIKWNSAGNLALKVDGTGSTTSIPSMYNATTLLGQIIEGQLISSLSAGLHTIRLEVLGKNLSSAGFHCFVSFLAIRKRP